MCIQTKIRVTIICRSMSYLLLQLHRTTTQTSRPKRLRRLRLILVRKTEVKPILGQSPSSLARDSRKTFATRRILTVCFPHPSWWRDTQVADHATCSARSYRASFNQSFFHQHSAPSLAHLINWRVAYWFFQT